MKRFMKAAGDVLLPRTCIVCGCRLNLDERHLCIGCMMDLPLTRFWEREHNPMADKFNEKIQELIEAGTERRGEARSEVTENIQRERYAYAAALFIYHSDANYRRIPYHIKYQGDTEIGEYFGKMLGKKLAEAVRAACHETEAQQDSRLPQEDGFRMWDDADMLIPVPLHWTRQWKRGYNQAEVIAGAVAEAMGVPMRNDILERKRRTKTQIRLNIEEKAKNVKGAFAVRKAVRLEAEDMDSSWDKIQHVIIVDDIFTTGSTLTACFAALREVFPSSVRISVLTLGYLER